MPEIMLADRFIEAAATYRGPKVLRDEYAYIAGKIKSAQRFYVSQDVRGAIRSLLTSRPSTLIEAARFAKLPYESCWFEWIPPGDSVVYPGQLEVHRCGAMLEAYGPHGFTMFTAWEFDKQTLFDQVKKDTGQEVAIDLDKVPLHGLSALVGAYDLSSFDRPALMDSDPTEKWFHQRALTMEDLSRQRDDERNGVRWVFKDPKEWQAIKALETRSAYRVHHEAHGEEKIAEQQMMTGDVGSIIHDIQDEMGHLFATLILMNSKNCIEIAKTEPPMKLNKARSKRGKPELLPYSTVKIELSKSQQRAVASGLISREEARRHLVRGHFKVRATGVFWWGEFIRGSAARGTIERRAHLVEAGHGEG